MPVLDSTDGGAPRSALRYRSLTDTNKRSIVTTAAHPVALRASRTRPQPADDDLISEWKRVDSGELDIERETNPPVRAAVQSAKPQASAAEPVAARPRARFHPLLYLGLGMLGVLIISTVFTAGAGWWENTMNYLHYGNPPTYQLEAVVGHNDSVSHPSHYIALNLHGRIQIIEFPGGDGSHARIYLGPQLYGSDADKAPVTLKFVDINNDGRPDMLAFFQASWIVFINTPQGFRSPNVEEQQDATRYLATHKSS